MEAAASALAIVQACLVTAKGLHDIIDKYRNAATTITAIHAETTAVAASVQLLQHILQDPKNADLVQRRFEVLPDLHRNFTVAIASLEMVLACLDSEIERLHHGFGSGGYLGKRVRARLLWRESSMRDLLQTLRGQHSAIFSVVQCFQMQSIADANLEVERLRATILSRVVKAPSIRHISAVCADFTATRQDLSQSTTTAQPLAAPQTSSEERISKAFSQYRSAMSMSSPESVSTCSSNGEHTSEEEVLEPVQDNVTTLRWPVSLSGWDGDCTVPSGLESDPEREPNKETKIDDLPAPSLNPVEGYDDGKAIIALDLATFLQHLRNFMPAVSLTSDSGCADGQSCVEEHELHDGGDPKPPGTLGSPDVHTNEPAIINRRQSSESFDSALELGYTKKGGCCCSSAPFHPSQKIHSDSPRDTCYSEVDGLPSALQQVVSTAADVRVAGPVMPGSSQVSISSRHQPHEDPDPPQFSIVSTTKPLLHFARLSNSSNADGIGTTAFQSTAISFFTPKDKPGLS